MIIGAAAQPTVAEVLACPLLTGDAKLIGHHQAEIELYPTP